MARPVSSRKAVGGMLHGDHACLAYDHPRERDAIMEAFVRDGLCAGDAVLHLVDTEPEMDAAKARLRAAFGDGHRVEVLLASGVLPGSGALHAPDVLSVSGVLSASGASPARHVLPGAGAVPAPEVPPARGALPASGTPVARRVRPGGGALSASDVPPASDALPACGGLGEVVRDALGRGHAGVRITVEPTPSPRGLPGTEPFAVFEDAIDRVVTAPGSRVMALCQYDRRWFGAAALRALRGRHGASVRADDVYDDGVLTIAPLFAPPGLRLSGALDASTLPALLAALRDLDDGAAHLCLDLSRLDFCDLDGARALVEANRSTAVLDRQVILRSMPGCVELMLRVSGWEDAPGIVREGTR